MLLLYGFICTLAASLVRRAGIWYQKAIQEMPSEIRARLRALIQKAIGIKKEEEKKPDYKRISRRYRSLLKNSTWSCCHCQTRQPFKTNHKRFFFVDALVCESRQCCKPICAACDVSGQEALFPVGPKETIQVAREHLNATFGWTCCTCGRSTYAPLVEESDPSILNILRRPKTVERTVRKLPCESCSHRPCPECLTWRLSDSKAEGIRRFREAHEGHEEAGGNASGPEPEARDSSPKGALRWREGSPSLYEYKYDPKSLAPIGPSKSQPQPKRSSLKGASTGPANEAPGKSGSSADGPDDMATDTASHPNV
ncbi:hypothetical protein BDY21DRAFT_405191 [Lineolata rhizophorae]|uniref:Zinc-binding domain-containing protein n=1 Tax=Lineolata rhizophorae TaxID=578093 RepID=A0A6A6NLJ8_9PEZI|nr:hypothetical protein BDY21DRAFT_405191 [Lineolata rhizophorae]